jgi:hypothetical protein
VSLGWVTLEPLPPGSVVAMKTRKPRTLVVVSAFVLAFGSLILAPSASADGCVGGVPIGNTTSCTANGSSSGFNAPPLTGSGNPFGSFGGINCTAANYHTCRALQETGNAPP